MDRPYDIRRGLIFVRYLGTVDQCKHLLRKMVGRHLSYISEYSVIDILAQYYIDHSDVFSGLGRMQCTLSTGGVIACSVSFFVE